MENYIKYIERNKFHFCMIGLVNPIPVSVIMFLVGLQQIKLSKIEK